jgi:hypothetical protein
MLDGLLTWTAHSEHQKVWAGPSWSSIALRYDVAFIWSIKPFISQHNQLLEASDRVKRSADAEGMAAIAAMHGARKGTESTSTVLQMICTCQAPIFGRSISEVHHGPYTYAPTAISVPIEQCSHCIICTAG